MWFAIWLLVSFLCGQSALEIPEECQTAFLAPPIVEPVEPPPVVAEPSPPAAQVQQVVEQAEDLQQRTQAIEDLLIQKRAQIERRVR